VRLFLRSRLLTSKIAGFVYNSKLTAISSYNRAVHWPDVAPHKKLIEERLVQYWSGVKDKVGCVLSISCCRLPFCASLCPHHALAGCCCIDGALFAVFTGRSSRTSLWTLRSSAARSIT
jgi:hypothetical protein